MDWVKFLASAVVGLVTVFSSLQMPTADLWVIFAILSTVIGYCAKTYFTFEANMATYQNLITQSCMTNNSIVEGELYFTCVMM